MLNGSHMTFPRSPKEHFTNVGRLLCVVSGRPNPTIHHVQGPSIRRELSARGYDPTKGMGRRGYGDALVIPLDAEFHTGRHGIDGHVGRGAWEERWGEQSRFIGVVSEAVGYDLWELHKLWLPVSRIFRRPCSSG